jgi:outer membrane protein TolC
MKNSFFLLLLLIFASFSLNSFAEETTAPIDSLVDFALKVVEGNRNLLSAAHDLEIAMLEKHKAMAAFSPQFSHSYDRSKSANKSFNPISGVEEDYSTRTAGNSSSISQRTPLGQIGYDYSVSKTEYTSSRTSYFNSLYLSWQAGLFRNDARLNSLERRIIHTGYDISLAQNDALLLDVLQNSVKSLFDRTLVSRNEGLKKDNLGFYATLVEEAEVKLKNGLGSELDLKQASMRYAQAETEHEETILSLRDQDRNLKLKLGQVKWEPESVALDLNGIIKAIPEKLSLETLLDNAYKNRPDYRMIESRYKLRKAAFDRARMLSRPDVSARLRWGQQGRGFEKSAAEAMSDKSWNVSVTWTTSFGPESEKIDFTIEKERLQSFAESLEQKKDDVEVAVTSALERLEFDRKNLASLQASFKLSQEVLEGQRLNFQLGRISLLDLTRYQQDYNNASLAVARGESRLILSWIDLLYETGTLAQYLGADNISGRVEGLPEYRIEAVENENN